ncbi:hypothetical protein SAMN05920897_11648 [Alkalispirochaeta americana]|uniref:TonB-dependent receptor n=1 Tax=Alkalispirochaeta americana TaxID=159291 RepID=A0A1N6W1L6_9SPIO|nr:hypothetical protein [Alkalispirochaeta americana]SIQ83806.1 hypothetical protein SAMN05920897_11648 [Alkalispirochaeta americana]
MKMVRNTACFLLITALLVVTGGVGLGLEAEEIIDLSPERTAVEVAPVEVALGGLPALETLPLVEELLDPDYRPADALAAALPVPSIPREAVGEAVAVPEEQLFFNATLGAGSIHSVLGSINVFRLGEGPQFRLGYNHRSSDGFNFEEVGSGFFLQENLIEAWLRIDRQEKISLEVEMEYGDHRFGLQQQPVYYSAETRAIQGRAEVQYLWDHRTTSSVALEVDDFSRVLTAMDSTGDSEREQFYRVAPVLSGTMELPRLTVEADLDYSGHFSTGAGLDPASLVGSSLRIEGIPLEGLSLTGRGAVRYRFDDKPYFPVEAGFQYNHGDRWTLRGGGGYRVLEQSYVDLWEEYPVVEIPEDATEHPPLDEVFFAEGELSLNLRPGFLQANAGFGWFLHQDRLISEAYRDDRAVYPLRIDEFEHLETKVGLSVSPRDWLLAEMGWTGRWEDRDTGVAEQSLNFSLRGDRGGLVADLEMDIPLEKGEMKVPLLGAGVRYGLARDVELRVFVSDLLAPFETEGRTRRGIKPSGADPFIEPGFEAGASVRVSF